MVYFQDVLPFSRSCQLVIINDEDQTVEKKTTLTVRTPLIANPSEGSFSTFGYRIIEGVIEWENDLQFTEEFQYVKGYWEWTKDLKSARIYDYVYATFFAYDRNSNIIKAFLEAWCPSTNIPLTNLRELSISLWDLRTLAVSIESWIAFWSKKDLCSFVLPVENAGLICPSTFKMASIMASGRRVSLAILVLASIYKGLNRISSSSRPSYVKSFFLAHFIYGWLAFYFKTHYQVWQGTSGPKMTLHSGEGGKDFLYVDNGNAEDFEQDYFIAIHSSYLPLRRLQKVMAKVHGNYFESNIESLSNSKPDALMGGEEHDKEGNPLDKEAWSPPKESERKSYSHPLEESDCSNLKKEILDINDDVELQDSQGSVVGSNLLDIVTPNAEIARNEEVNLPKTNEPSHNAAVLVFKGKKFVLNHQKEFLKKLWSDLQQRIADTPIKSVLSIQDDAQFVLESMKNFNKFDIPQLEKLLKALFDKANAYDKTRSTSFKKASKELLAQQVGIAKDHLHNVQAREFKEVNQIRSTEEELESIEKELKNLKEHKNLCASLKQQQQLLQIAQTEVHEIEEEITAIENDLVTLRATIATRPVARDDTHGRIVMLKPKTGTLTSAIKLKSSKSHPYQ
ncbi:hypothetical protein CDL12_10834 [Handroanthus impetiginosus]|uniref:Aminotransferase-like plant mobile domain-containing protein n=1 Tax=Handroanthus impetiginosus TaxID=429701 RepID=A0A2G9HG79_9LAMI|nr:hypothetical protein CDL12_10834 [Handroanthus impetiginosus]